MSALFFQSTQDAQTFYVLHTLEAIGATAQQKLCELLQAVPIPEGAPAASAKVFVTARAGTVSPWSSKATDILRQTGLLAAKSASRIERIDCMDSKAIASKFDPLTQSQFATLADCAQVFDAQQPECLQRIPVMRLGRHALEQANSSLGLALSDPELDWLTQHFKSEARDPSDAELVMFAQANSEHCRHKIFNAKYVVDGVHAEKSMFGQIRTTHANQPEGTVLAYADNAAILAQPNNKAYHHVLKAETHNHPTAVAPYPGAATGSGGEIRDEGATGRGATPVAGLSAYAISGLNFGDAASQLGSGDDFASLGCTRPQLFATAPHLASSLDILTQAPLGAAAFNNEFGRPNLGGALRVFEQDFAGKQWGYHKPIMLAAGWGLMDAQHAFKHTVQAGDLLVQLGGPGYLIGFGGGAASSKTLAQDNAELDFASVQRDNAEMERRAQMVINACTALGANNPIVSIHDVGAGGLSNALPELVAADSLGAKIDFNAIPLGSSDMSPMQVWSNESQERYVLVIKPQSRALLEALCAKERCPVAVLGVATAERRFQLIDETAADAMVVDWAMDALLGGLPAMVREVASYESAFGAEGSHASQLGVGASQLGSGDDKLLVQILSHPSVASKRYLVHIGDRTVGGHSHRDSLVGPWQVPVADCVVTLNHNETLEGAAAALGERMPVAVLDAPASGRLAVAESLLNLWAAPVADIKNVKLSCNWMANAADASEDAALRATVDATVAFCQALDVAVPVGKDSLSMKAAWRNDAGESVQVQSPVSLMVTAFAPLPSIAGTLTPLLQSGVDSQLIHMSCGPETRLGGSIAQQLLGFDAVPDIATPDIDPTKLQALLGLLDASKKRGTLLAYHDVSDGGVWATACEMAFAARAGLAIKAPSLAALLCEEPGVVVQVASHAAQSLIEEAQALGLVAVDAAQVHWSDRPHITVDVAAQAVLDAPLGELLAAWDRVAFAMCQRRDNPETARQEHETVCGMEPMLWSQVTTSLPPIGLSGGSLPRAAVLREQGVNSHREMSFALSQAGFDVVDVHMSDLQSGRYALKDFQLLAACGGFSYGDVLGAGSGWAKSILFNDSLAAQFKDFFAREDSLTLGVCNGCQMLSQLGELMPQAPVLPRFVQNESQRFEARVSMVEVLPSDSVFLQDLVGSTLAVVVSHGEGRSVRQANNGGRVQGTSEARDSSPEPNWLAALQEAIRFVTPDGKPANTFPHNPNGSEGGLTAFSTAGGRILMMMPHPERSLRVAQMSWTADQNLAGLTPWAKMFAAARRFFGSR